MSAIRSDKFTHAWRHVEVTVLARGSGRVWAHVGDTDTTDSLAESRDRDGLATVRTRVGNAKVELSFVQCDDKVAVGVPATTSTETSVVESAPTVESALLKVGCRVGVAGLKVGLGIARFALDRALNGIVVSRTAWGMGNDADRGQRGDERCTKEHSEGDCR